MKIVWHRAIVPNVAVKDYIEHIAGNEFDNIGDNRNPFGAKSMKPAAATDVLEISDDHPCINTEKMYLTALMKERF